jgi:hypothetical protein
MIAEVGDPTNDASAVQIPGSGKRAIPGSGKRA